MFHILRVKLCNFDQYDFLIIISSISDIRSKKVETSMIISHIVLVQYESNILAFRVFYDKNVLIAIHKDKFYRTVFTQILLYVMEC